MGIRKFSMKQAHDIMAPQVYELLKLVLLKLFPSNVFKSL